MKDSFPELPDDLREQVTSLQTALVGLINDSFETKTKIDKLSEQTNDLQISQQRADERINAIILKIEKFLSEKS